MISGNLTESYPKTTSKPSKTEWPIAKPASKYLKSGVLGREACIAAKARKTDAMVVAREGSPQQAFENAFEFKAAASPTSTQTHGFHFMERPIIQALKPRNSSATGA